MKKSLFFALFLLLCSCEDTNHIHNIVVDPAVEPTCTEKGYTEGSHCSTCGEIIVPQNEVPALDHNIVIVPETLATCTSDGYTYSSYCDRCNKVFNERRLIQHSGHNIVVDPAVEPTCTEKGYTEGSHCSTCGEIIVPQNEVPALDHNIVIVPETLATCTSDGYTYSSYCDRCNKVFNERRLIQHSGHNIVIDPAVEPTCTEKGYTEGSHCSTCGEIIVPQNEIQPLGHDYYINNPTIPTSTNSGKSIGLYCGRCSTVFIEQHNLDKTFIEFNSETSVVIDENDSYQVNYNEYTFKACNLKKYENGFLTLIRMGAFANITRFAKINSLKLIANGDVENCTITFGNDALPFLNPITIEENNEFYPKDAQYFTISYNGYSQVKIEEIQIDFLYQFEDNPKTKLPRIDITTELNDGGEHLPINSLVNYTNSIISITDYENAKYDIKNVPAGVRLRGNTTAGARKKPYRIKFDKKQSVFGLKKQKSWVLLAEYFDGSSLHNYMAHDLVSMFDSFEFKMHLRHVELYMNGVYQGLYVICEQPDEKEGRTDIEQELSGKENVDDINFMIELDARLPSDSQEIENKTYVKINDGQNDLYFGIKYPKIEDFPDYYKESDSSCLWDEFIVYLKELLSNAYCAVLSNEASSIEEFFDKESLFKYALIDTFCNELDHSLTSFKMYKKNGSKLSFGPCWDYDTVAFGFTCIGSPYEDPYVSSLKELSDFPNNRILQSVNFVDSWNEEFLLDMKEFCLKNGNKIIQDFIDEYTKIIDALIDNNELWQYNRISTVYQNLLYLYDYLTTRINHFIYL